MKYPAKMIASLALAGILVPAIVGANENQAAEANAKAGGGKSRAAGIRHLFINKPAIAERARARLESRPKQTHPHTGRGFLLEKVQGAFGTEKADLEKLRRQQLNRIEGRAGPDFPAPKPAEKGIHYPAELVDHEAAGGESGGGVGGMIFACAVATLALLVLRRRRGRNISVSRGGKKKARELY